MKKQRKEPTAHMVQLWFQHFANSKLI